MGGPKQTLPESCQKEFFNQEKMGDRSDIEEIQIEESVNTGTDEDSNQGSERQLRTRNKQKKKGGRQGKLIDKERQEFLSDFERNPSEREKRKLKKKTNYKDSARGRNKNNVYDEKGILISCGKDVCDCMDDSCPGCHFPCPKCRSNKCGNECRQNRKWMFESVELDGNPNSVKYNPYAKDLQIYDKKPMKLEARLKLL